MMRHYFDHNATTPMAPEVFADVLNTTYGNASSIHHEGQKARQALENARRSIARIMGAAATEIVFTSGGTESDNLAILGLVRNLPQTRKHVIASTIEHPAVLEPCRQLEREGVEVTYVRVDGNGFVHPDEVRRQLRPETVLVTVMHANNEVGTIEPLREIAAIVQSARDHGQTIYLHSDGVQAPGRIAIDLAGLEVDLYSLSAHKVYGPKGIGALYVRRDVPLRGIQFGGRHERERRAGTENVAAAVAFSRALDVANRATAFTELEMLRDRFERTVLAECPGIEVNAAGVARLPNTSNLYFDGVDGESLVIALDLKGFAVSSGAACSSGSVEPSHVLLAMGRSHQEARRCVRFSFGLGNTPAEVDELAAAVIGCARQLRAAHPRRGASKNYVVA